MIDNDREILDALNLDNWQESKGFIDCMCLKCPHCEGISTPKVDLDTPKRLFCPYCGKVFIAQIIDTPVGLAFSTRTEFTRAKP